MSRLLVLCAVAAVALAVPAVLVPEHAQAQAEIIIGVPPPPERIEVIAPPPPHPELFVWDKGHWRWDGHAHFWVAGHYERIPHPGAIRVPGHWEQMPDGRWHFHAPHWE